MFIINLGLRFQVEFPNSSHISAYSKVMKSFLQIFIGYAKEGHTVIYRESSVTHFNTDSGAFRHNIHDRDRRNATSVVSTVAQRLFGKQDRTDWNRQENSSSVIDSKSHPHLDFHCAAVPNMTMLLSQRWLNDEVKLLLQSLDPNRVVGLAPFFNLTG